jgi:RNA polymerase sigma-70 factor (ECF subfamily)
MREARVIAVVDDDESFREALQRLLRTLGFQVEVARAPSGPIPPDRDADLVAELRGQAPGAVERLVARYGALLYRTAVGITGSPEDAEAVVQDAFWAAICRIGTFRHQSAFGSWLYRIAANAAYRARRGRRHARQDLSWDEVWSGVTEYGQQLAPLTDRSADTERPAVQAELRHALAAAIDDLPADHRVAFWLRQVEGLSNAETARALGLSLPAVESRVHRSRLCLRKRLAGYVTERGARRAGAGAGRKCARWS